MFQMFPGAIHWSGKFEGGDWKIPKVGHVWGEHGRDMIVRGIQLDAVRPSRTQLELEKKANEAKQARELTLAEDSSQKRQRAEEEEWSFEMDAETELDLSLILLDKDERVSGITLRGIPGDSGNLNIEVKSTRARELVEQATAEHSQLKREPFWTLRQQAWGEKRAFLGGQQWLNKDTRLFAQQDDVYREGRKVVYPERGVCGYLPAYGLSPLIYLIAQAFDRRQDDKKPSPVIKLPVSEPFELVSPMATHCTFYAHSVSEIGSRKAMNEDTFFVDDQPDAVSGLMLAAIFDGHGGHLVAEFAAREVRTMFYARFQTFLGRSTRSISRVQIIRECLRSTISDLEKECYRRVQEHRSAWTPAAFDYIPRSSGACANVVVLDTLTQEVHCANVGDCFSFAVSANKEGEEPEVARFSTDHSCYTSNREITRVFAAGGYCDSSTNRTMGNFMPSRSLGDVDFKMSCPEFKAAYVAEPELEYAKLHPLKNHIIVLSTDGFAFSRRGEKGHRVMDKVTGFFLKGNVATAQDFEKSSKDLFERGMTDGLRGDFDPRDDRTLVLLGVFNPVLD